MAAVPAIAFRCPEIATFASAETAVDVAFELDVTDEAAVAAVATDADIATDLPKLPLNDFVAIADFVVNTLDLQECPC